MRIIILLGILCFVQIESVVAQSTELDVGMSAESDVMQYAVQGYLDMNIPYELSYRIDDECTGKLEIGSNYDIQLEGECSDSLISLYEFDEHSRVIGVISGSINEDEYDLNWSNYDHSISYQLKGERDVENSDRIRIYNLKSDSVKHQLVIWKDRKSLSYISPLEYELAWQNYICSHAEYACQYEGDKDEMVNLSLSDRIVSSGSKLYYLDQEIEVRNVHQVGFDHFYNFSIPVLNDSKFDPYLNSIIGEYISKLNEQSSENVEEPERSDRFLHSARGDFYISLLTDELVSGFLMFYGTEFPKPVTIPFSFDRNKKEIIDIREIWKKDFNFSFFLQSLIKDEARKNLQKEDAFTRRLMDDITFSYFNFTMNELLIFTEFNLLYGRRVIAVPYESIASFIDHKAIQNLISLN